MTSLESWLEQGRLPYLLRSLSLTLGADWERTVDILNAARATRARSEYESAGTATEAQLTELQEQIALLQPAVVEALRAKMHDGPADRRTDA